MLSTRTLMATAGNVPAGAVNWSDYDSTGDKTPVEFCSGATSFINVVPIDDTRAIVIYAGASSYCYARIATVNGAGTASFGTETALLSAAITDCKAALLDSTHAVVAVESGGAVKTIAFDFSGTTIGTVGSAVSTETVNSDFLAITALSGSDFFVAYHDTAAGNGTVYYATVSGTAITMGNGIDYTTSDLNDLNMASITSTKAIIVSAQIGTNDCQAKLITYSGTTPSVSDTLTILNGSYTVDSIGIAKISSTQVVAAYAETFANSKCYAVVLTESSGTLSKGTIIESSASVAEEQSVAIPDSTHAVCTVGVNTTEIQTTVLDISGTSLTKLTTYQNISGNKNDVTSGTVGANWVLSAYSDADDSGKGKVKVLGV